LNLGVGYADPLPDQLGLCETTCLSCLVFHENANALFGNLAYQKPKYTDTIIFHCLAKKYFSFLFSKFYGKVGQTEGFGYCTNYHGYRPETWFTDWKIRISSNLGMYIIAGPFVEYKHHNIALQSWCSVLDLGRSNPICKLLFTYYFFN
jgi:hypothetical protein